VTSFPLVTSLYQLPDIRLLTWDPNERPRPPEGRRLDLPGQVTGATGIAALTYAVISGGAAGWTAPLTLAAFVVAVAGLVMATSSAVAVQSVPGPLAGMAGAGNNAMRQLGAALGPAVLGVLVGPRTGADLAGAVHAAAAVLATVFATAAATSALLLRTRKAQLTIPMTTLERTA